MPKFEHKDIQALKALVDKIALTLAKANAALNFPADAVAESGRVYLTGAGNNKHYDALKRAEEIMKAEAKAIGEAKRDEALKGFYRDLHAMRAVLPGVASLAAIAMGAVANEMDKPQ